MCKSASELFHGHLCFSVFDTLIDFLRCKCLYWQFTDFSFFFLLTKNVCMHKPCSKAFYVPKCAYDMSDGHLCLGVFNTFPGFLQCQCPQMRCACMGNLQAFFNTSLLYFCSAVYNISKQLKN